MNQNVGKETPAEDGLVRHHHELLSKIENRGWRVSHTQAHRVDLMPEDEDEPIISIFWGVVKIRREMELSAVEMAIIGSLAMATKPTESSESC